MLSAVQTTHHFNLIIKKMLLYCKLLSQRLPLLPTLSVSHRIPHDDTNWFLLGGLGLLLLLVCKSFFSPHPFTARKNSWRTCSPHLLPFYNQSNILQSKHKLNTTWQTVREILFLSCKALPSGHCCVQILKKAVSSSARSSAWSLTGSSAVRVPGSF